MNKFLSAIAALTMLSVPFFNAKLDITGRWDRGTLQTDGQRVYTNAQTKEFYSHKYNAWYGSMYKFVTCAKDLSTCKNSSRR